MRKICCAYDESASNINCVCVSFIIVVKNAQKSIMGKSIWEADRKNKKGNENNTNNKNNTPLTGGFAAPIVSQMLASPAHDCQCSAYAAFSVDGEAHTPTHTEKERER